MLSAQNAIAKKSLLCPPIGERTGDITHATLSARNATKGDEKISNKINCSVACIHIMDHRFLLDELDYINCSAYEFLVYSLWNDHYRKVGRELKACGVQFDSMHGPKQTGRLLSEDDPESHKKALEQIKNSIDVAHELGIHVLTIHLWDQNSTDPKLEKNLDSLYTLKDYALDHGVNISVEFIPHTKGGGYVPTAQYLYENMDTAFSFTLDLEFAAWDNEIGDMVKFVDRITNIHIRDYNGSPVDENGRRFYCLPGLGSTDFTFAFRELKKRGYAGLYTLEARHYSTKDVNDSLAVLHAAMNVG